ncbi:MAG: DNA-binding protein [Spirochaetae bacterium HGW-Spirochaetae-1]|jgi:HEPN domain-containing protein|nr:MAG: DNA-binding protein [Spirochaetae bacterium HGW-Spirochaetae-1]
MDLKKQVGYWHRGSLSDIDTAGILIEKNKYPEGMFFCHLAIEKILKAVYVKTQSEFAPKSHNLFMLSEKAGIDLKDDIEYFFGILMMYQTQGRYPEPSPVVHSKTQIFQFLDKTKEVRAWLEKML